MSVARPVRIRPTFTSAHGGFYFQAFSRSVSLPAAGYNYNSVRTPLLAGLSPARTAASFAAPIPHRRRPSIYGSLARTSDALELQPNASFHDPENRRGGCLRGKCSGTAPKMQELSARDFHSVPPSRAAMGQNLTPVHSGLIPSSLMIGHHFSASAFRRAASASGVWRSRG